ncbi:7792_t:CDS:1 [Funneliformis geosporum]|uniref:Post-GPI attachment to proteins factor 3 n=1 Tax=Funneliformis geosporum TaxID=1117311 RepID=A0A9W4WWE8_9GLOM|nr:15245_t:CDS:1 [Funneliformis geosporum]CAI2187710.1 7792_t:CDS:1 [Funneliformis geosporum]
MLVKSNLVLFSSIILLLIISLPPVFSSIGDRSEEFQTCVNTCVSTVCSQNPTLSLYLRFFAWTCEDECKYNCMHEITDQAIHSNQEIHQYYGKWPFHRLLGIQEPASVLFSVLNGYVHYRYLPLLRRLPDSYYMKKFYIYYAYIGINSWIWSIIYHSRDFPFTEKLDYYSAGLAILYSLFYGVLRIFQIRNFQQTTLWAIICLSAYVAHVSYLHFINFDYGYNILANVIVGMLNNALWISWSISHWYKRPDDAWKPIVCVTLILLAMSLEIFDFPPWWGIVDAHALWHFSTIYLIAYWYNFLLEDARIENFRESKGKKIDRTKFKTNTFKLEKFLHWY